MHMKIIIIYYPVFLVLYKLLIYSPIDDDINDK